MEEDKKEPAGNADQCAQELQEKLSKGQMGCADLDPVRGCVPRSGKCYPNCPEKKKQRQSVGCGGPICFKS